MDKQNDSKTAHADELWEKPELTELDIRSTEGAVGGAGSDGGVFPDPSAAS
ncbi:MAG: hypothetical protein ACKVGW_05555 [Verrucomicrobiia bacterium]